MSLARFAVFLRFAAAVVAAAALAGCSIPTPAYRRIDENSPQFKAAVAVETEKLIAAGDRSAASAAKLATKRVTRQFIEDEKKQRTQKAAPLAEVMAKFEQPRGCWAYTVTITRRENGVATTTVENFDAFQPEERLWTLVTRNGEAPDEKAQAAYRAKKLKAWKKAQTRESKYTTSELITTRALFSDLEISAPDNESQVTYTFTSEGVKVPLVANAGGFRETYVADRATATLLQRTQVLRSPASLFGGTTKIDQFQSTTDYMLVEPTTPPFAAKTTVRFRGRLFGSDMEVEQELVYSNYRRVKCYDDRFEVKIGPTDMIDFVPGSP